jgi:hypothetical protein
MDLRELRREDMVASGALGSALEGFAGRRGVSPLLRPLLPRRGAEDWVGVVGFSSLVSVGGLGYVSLQTISTR